MVPYHVQLLSCFCSHAELRQFKNQTFGLIYGGEAAEKLRLFPPGYDFKKKGLQKKWITKNNTNERKKNDNK